MFLSLFFDVFWFHKAFNIGLKASQIGYVPAVALGLPYFETNIKSFMKSKYIKEKGKEHNQFVMLWPRPDRKSVV